LWEQGSGPQVKGLLNGDLDVGFMFGPPSVDGLRSREVIGVRLVAVVGDHHEWAGRDAVVFPELANQSCMLCKRATSPAMYNTVLAAAQRTNTKLRIVAEVDDPGAAWLWVTTQPVAGIASVERARAMKGTIIVPIIEPMLTVPVHAVWRPPMSNHVAALLESVDATAPPPAALPRARAAAVTR
jgi:DNA-binding transcriptional LysR family regulator